MAAAEQMYSEAWGHTIPLDAGSLTWRYFGQWLGFAFGAVPQLEQVMHPVLGQAVEEHSNTKVDPFDRLIRSMGPIYGVIYDGPDAEATAVAVRRYHEHIKGTMPDGTRYSGLNPEVFHWAHATFVHGLIYAFPTILRSITRAEQEQLYAESREWYRLYGMTMRGVPETLDEFDALWEHYVTEVLRPTPFAVWLLATFKAPPAPPGLTWIPGPLWWPISRVAGHFAVILASGLLHPVTRESLALPWRRREQVQFRALRLGLRGLVAITPPRLRYHPRALDGWRREAEAAGIPVGRFISESVRRQPS